MATPPPPPPAGNRWRRVTTSPFPSPCPSSPVPESTTTTKSTAQVFKEIKLASLCDGSSSSSSSSTANSSRSSSVRNILLHDFLAGPFSKHSSVQVFTAECAQPTALNFSSSCACHNQSHNSFLSSSFDALMTSTICPSNGRKRARQDVCGLSDQRYQRMIKNRESAVRSRARKQETLPLCFSATLLNFLKLKKWSFFFISYLFINSQETISAGLYKCVGNQSCPSHGREFKAQTTSRRVEVVLDVLS